MRHLSSLELISHLVKWVLITQLAFCYNDIKHLIGVRPDRRGHYELSEQQNFKCLDGSRTIPKQFLNDDYCDCIDASDEPGTSACPHGQFFCQNHGYIQKLIPSAWVNDGQCDCCDASDEYDSNATCANDCAVLGELYRQEQERHKEVADKGSAMRSQYKEQAKAMRDQSTQLLEQYRRDLSEKEQAVKKLEEELNSDFGPSQVYLPLKNKCFDFRDREYVYKLCLFERATQESISGSQTELGRWAGWNGPNENPYSRQRYEGGMQCWNGPTRSATINIACGIEDKIIAVSEPAKCEYVYDFITPAACPDLDPPEVTPSDVSDQNQQDIEDQKLPEQEDVHREEEEDLSTNHEVDEPHDEL